MSMIEKDDGGAAFPVVWPDDKGVQYYGLSMRDYFAAKAMQGYWSDSRFQKIGMDELARHCYAMSDAMLEARNQ